MILCLEHGAKSSHASLMFPDFPEKCDGLHRDVHLFVVLMSAGTKLENLMETMRAEIAAQPPVEGSFAPRRGDFCIAKFADGEW